MRQRTFNVLAVALVGVAVVAGTRWPRINVVETGRTPEYPQLRDREYAAPEAAVGRAAKAAVEALPGWSFVGAGQGRGGTALQALATNPAPVKTEMTITIRRPAGKTVVHVRARSIFGPWDFGQGARHIEAFLVELDRQMASTPAKAR